MATRVLSVIAFATLTAALSSADDAATAVNTGDFVIVELAGDAALAYSRISLRPIAAANDGSLTVQVMAELRKLPDPANVRMQHLAEIVVNEERYRLTLTGTIPASRIVAETSLPGAVVSASPGAAGAPARSEIITLQVRLEDLRGFKLQRWQLMEEIVD